MDTDRMENTNEGLDQDLLDQLSQEEGFDEGEYSSEDKAKRELAEYGQQADAVMFRVQSLKLSPNHPVALDIRDNLLAGRLDRATQKLIKLEAVKTSEVEKTNEEKYQARLAQDGINPYNPRSPRAETRTSASDVEIRRNFRENPHNTQAQREFMDYQRRMGKA